MVLKASLQEQFLYFLISQKKDLVLGCSCLISTPITMRARHSVLYICLNTQTLAKYTHIAKFYIHF